MAHGEAACLSPRKQCKIDFREKWNILKQSEKRWKKGEPLSLCVLKNAHESNFVVNIGCHRNEYVIYSADRRGHIKTWNVHTRNCDDVINCGVSIRFVQFSDHDIAVVAPRNGMQIWDLRKQFSVTTLSELQYDCIILHNTRLLAVSNNIVELWDTGVSAKVHNWLHKDTGTSILCAALHGDTIVTGAQKNIFVWDTRTQHCERVIKDGAFDIVLNEAQIVSCRAEVSQKRSISNNCASINLLAVRDLRSEHKQERSVEAGYLFYSLEGHKLVSGNELGRKIDVWDVGSTTDFKYKTPSSLQFEDNAACITSRVSKLCVATRNGDIHLYDF